MIAQPNKRSMLVLLAALTMGVPGCHTDMWQQPKLRAQRDSDFYADGAASRRPPANTIAQGELREDGPFYTGVVGKQMVTELPFPVTRAVIERGRERFDIHCAPCHGPLGYGDGMVSRRGLAMRRKPADYHTDRLRAMPIGHFYGAMTQGYGVMYSAANRVEPRDRWCIAAYIRVLQLSQYARRADVPDGALPAAARGPNTSEGQPR